MSFKLFAICSIITVISYFVGLFLLLSLYLVPGAIIIVACILVSCGLLHFRPRKPNHYNPSRP